MFPRLVPVLAVPFVLMVALAQPALAEDGQGTRVSSGENVVTFGDDVHVRADESVDTVVVFGGDLRVDGTVRNGVYVFGGELLVGPGGEVGTGLTDQDVTVAVLGGETTAIPGAEVTGRELEINDLDWLGDGAGWLGAPFSGGTFGWGLGLAGALILGLLAATLLPRQLQAVKSELRTRPLPSFGWGLLALLVIVPLVSLVLLITVIGILALIPWLLIVVPAFCTLGWLAAGALLGELALQAAGSKRDELWLAVLVGVVALEIVSLIPVLGPLTLALMSLAGLGASLLALRSWRQNRKHAQIQAASPTATPPVTA
jgi:hypothetical protein